MVVVRTPPRCGGYIQSEKWKTSSGPTHPLDRRPSERLQAAATRVPAAAAAVGARRAALRATSWIRSVRAGPRVRTRPARAGPGGLRRAPDHPPHVVPDPVRGTESGLTSITIRKWPSIALSILPLMAVNVGAIEGHLRIVIDVSPLSVSRTGIGNYVRGLLTGLLEVAGGRHEVVAFGLSGPAGRRRIHEALEGVPVELPLAAAAAGTMISAWSKLGRPARGVCRPGSTSSTSRTGSYPPQRGGARVTTVHDLVPLRFPELIKRGDGADARSEVRERGAHTRPCSSPTRGSPRPS